MMVFDQLIQSVRLHERLVGQNNQCGSAIRIEGQQTSLERGSHTILVSGVDGNSHSIKGNLLLNCLGGVSKHQDDLICLRPADILYYMFKKGTIAQAQQLLGRAHTSGHASRKDDGGNSGMRLHDAIGNT
jgi:hypothetical protein